MKNLSHRLSVAMWARVQILWITLAIAALLLGGFAVWMGYFIRGNIQNELTSQQISFPAEENMTDREKEIDGLVENAGQPLSDGNQARVYAEYILLHMHESAEEAGYPEATYATLGQPQREFRAQAAEATETGDQAAIEEAQANLESVTQLRNSMLTGSNLRGNLLSAYGWDNVGVGIMIAGVFIIILAVMFFLLFIFERNRGHLPPTQMDQNNNSG